ncbi:MAG: DUF6717 family protein [Bacteroidota bacterium]
MTATIQLPVFTETRVFDFVKDFGKWYIELPEYEGSREDLRMVAGADTWLDLLSKNGNRVSLKISVEEALQNRIEKQFEVPVFGGAYYIARKLGNRNARHRMWLCPVTKFVFGEYPGTIYYEVR